jgi:hypothetical protein
MDTAQLLASLGTDKVTGVGVFKALRMQEIFDKKDKEKRTCIGYRYSMEISKLNAVLSLDLSESMYTRLTAEVAKESIVQGKSFLSYEADLSIEADAFGWSNDKGSGAMATSKFGSPFLTDYKKVS